MEQKLLVGSANMGTGLWTSICVAFCSLLGRESKNLKKKQDKVVALANNELNYQLKLLGGHYTLSDYRITWNGHLVVTVSAIAVGEGGAEEGGKAEQGNKCPKCGAPIEPGAMFCGECGEKLK